MADPLQIDLEDLTAKLRPDPFAHLPRNHFRTICADPPWRFRTWSETNQHKAASKHYPLMMTDDIKALPVSEIAAEHSVLLLWAVNPMVPHAIEVMKAWGFTYKTLGFIWAKTTSRTDMSWAPKYHMGLGYWTRANSEIVLLGVRGKPTRLAKDVRQLIVSSRREHSRKPDEFYERVQRLCGGPYIELFSRKSRPGWISWGDEVGKFNEESE